MRVVLCRCTEGSCVLTGRRWWWDRARCARACARLWRVLSLRRCQPVSRLRRSLPLNSLDPALHLSFYGSHDFLSSARRCQPVKRDSNELNGCSFARRTRPEEVRQAESPLHRPLGHRRRDRGLCRTRFWLPSARQTYQRCTQAKTVVAPLDRVKILFQASNPEFQKYSGVYPSTPP